MADDVEPKKKQPKTRTRRNFAAMHADLEARVKLAVKLLQRSVTATSSELVTAAIDILAPESP